MLDKWIGQKGLDYSDFVWRAATENAHFSSFRRRRMYARILENVDEAAGAECLSLITEPLLRTICLESEFADTIGAPKTALYEGRRLAPSTLRYGKIADDFVRCFPGFASFATVCEIGVGFGGQARVVATYRERKQAPLARYTLVDLPEVLMLAKRYLSHFELESPFAFLTKTELGRDSQTFDFAISNYAFSEFERPLQREYIEKVLLNARSGYIIMNSGAPDSAELKRKDVYLQDELLQLLPRATLAPEVPSTSRDNYVILFGEHNL
jgi:putative sugar O-methyltransferase